MCWKERLNTQLRCEIYVSAICREHSWFHKMVFLSIKSFTISFKTGLFLYEVKLLTTSAQLPFVHAHVTWQNKINYSKWWRKCWHTTKISTQIKGILSQGTWDRMMRTELTLIIPFVKFVRNVRKLQNFRRIPNGTAEWLLCWWLAAIQCLLFTIFLPNTIGYNTMLFVKTILPNYHHSNTSLPSGLHSTNVECK